MKSVIYFDRVKYDLKTINRDNLITLHCIYKYFLCDNKPRKSNKKKKKNEIDQWIRNERVGLAEEIRQLDEYSKL